jgi:hypothetical protein
MPSARSKKSTSKASLVAINSAEKKMNTWNTGKNPEKIKLRENRPLVLYITTLLLVSPSCLLSLPPIS